MRKNGQLGTVDKSLAQANKLYKDDSVRRAPLLGEQIFCLLKITQSRNYCYVKMHISNQSLLDHICEGSANT